MRQKLGQHFLKNLSVVQKTVDALSIKGGDTIIEIGPGKGVLTRPLMEACGKSGAKLITIERDSALASEIQAAGITVKEGDALQILPELLKKGVKVVGNIPYYISGKLFRVLSEAEERPELAILMVQREVAERASCQPPEMNRLAAAVQFWSDPEIIAFVPKKDFSPPPEVDSAVLKLTKKDDLPANADRYYSLVRSLFAQPRKTIANNLLPLFKGRDDVNEFLAKAGIDGSLRPQDLSVPQIAELAQYIG